MLKDLIDNLQDLKSTIRYYSSKDCFILGSYNLYTYRKIYMQDRFYINNEEINYRLYHDKNKNSLYILCRLDLIADLPIPEDKNEYFQLNMIHDYEGITYENLLEIVGFMEYMEIQHGWKINGR